MELSFESISGPTPAFIAGLVTSLHCLGMCGPLACAICPKGSCEGSSSHRLVPPLLTYHMGRLLSYSVLGCVAGFFGNALTFLFSTEFTYLLPWAFVLWFVLIAVGWEQYFRFPATPTSFIGKITGRVQKLGSTFLGSALGIATPLFPCGPLYLMIGVSALSGSAVMGTTIMAAFALGTTPLLFAAQFQILKLRYRLSPTTLRWGQACLALVSAGILFFRISYGEPPSTEKEPTCPACALHEKT